MNENEIWLPVVGFEGLYEVSSLGKVKSLGNDNTRKEKILRQGKNKDGYLIVVLYKEGKRKNFLVHRLVANLFIPNPNNLPTVNHIDENKENNCVDNLEWMNLTQQQRHGTCIQRRVASTGYKELVEKQSKRVFQYSLDSTLVAIWESTQECGRQGFDQGAVAKCCNGKLKSHKGYIWSYQELKKQES